jgi:hypothetical protein
MIKILLFAIVFISNAVMAGEKIPYQNWAVESNGKTNETYTIADANNSFGMFCGGDQCLFYLHQSLACTPGVKYSVLMNSPSVSTALSMECTPIGGSVFQILTPFDAVFKALQAGDSIGFAVALQSGAFAVTRFSLLGAKSAVDRVLSEAANAKKRESKPAAPPQILIIPPIQITPSVPQIPVPNLPQNTPQKPGSKDVSI